MSLHGKGEKDIFNGLEVIICLYTKACLAFSLELVAAAYAVRAYSSAPWITCDENM